MSPPPPYSAYLRQRDCDNKFFGSDCSSIEEENSCKKMDEADVVLIDNKRLRSVSEIKAKVIKVNLYHYVCCVLCSGNPHHSLPCLMFTLTWTAHSAVAIYNNCIRHLPERTTLPSRNSLLTDLNYWNSSKKSKGQILVVIFSRFSRFPNIASNAQEYGAAISFKRTVTGQLISFQKFQYGWADYFARMFLLHWPCDIINCPLAKYYISRQ